MPGPDPQQSSTDRKPGDFDPDAYRMTLGEHLDDLRRRLFRACIGVAIAVMVCLYYGEQVVTIFLRPLINGLRAAGLNPQIYYSEISEPFMTYLKVAVITSLAFASPWIAYQIWQFVAMGLYPRERKAITKYIPLSIALLIAGMVLVYFVVMPLTVNFLLAFGSSFKMPFGTGPHATTQVAATLPSFPSIPGDAANPTEGSYWINSVEGQLKVFLNGETRVIPFGPKSLLAPQITLRMYIELTMMTLLTFGVAFQLPLVVMALVAVGILNTQMLRQHRRIVYFVMSVVAAVVAPADVVSAMMALYIPLILLYEMGIWLAAGVEKRRNERRGFEVG